MSKNSRKLYCALHLRDIHLDAYLYNEEPIKYEIFYQKQLLFSGTSFQPLLNTPIFSLPTLIALLQYVMVPVNTAAYTDKQIEWVLSPNYKKLESHLQQYNSEKKWELYFRSALMYYRAESNIRLYWVVSKTRKVNNEWYGETILLTDEQKQALTDFLVKDAEAGTLEKIQSALEDNFSKSNLHPWMKRLRIKVTTIQYTPLTDDSAARELAIIRNKLLKNY